MLEYLANNPPGAWTGPLLGVIAFAETLFPPIPGDILFIVISGWALTGGLSLMTAAFYGVTGCILASCILFYIGHKPGRQFVEGWLKRKVEPERVDRAKSLIADRGPLILAVSRFIPGVRSLLVFMVLSIAGSIFGSNMQAAEGFMKHFEIWLWIILAVVVLIFLIIGIRRRRVMR
jgi:membrane protein DedA with SNARE-associated domain